VLLVAHGSRNPAAAVEHERLCAAVQAASDDGSATAPVVRPAYLEITEPSIPAAIDAAVAEGATSVRLLPHFLSPGNHVLVDLPAIASDAAARHPHTSIELAEHLGADPGLVALLATRVLAD
jgi:sirohydrochlorin ferrochelatase